MWDVISTATGQTISVHPDHQHARKIAAPMEHHRVVEDIGARYAFTHLPRPKMGQPSHVEAYARQVQREQLAAFIAHAEQGRPLGHGCRCVVCPIQR